MSEPLTLPGGFVEGSKHVALDPGAIMVQEEQPRLMSPLSTKTDDLVYQGLVHRIQGVVGRPAAKSTRIACLAFFKITCEGQASGSRSIACRQAVGLVTQQHSLSDFVDEQHMLL